MSANYEVWRYLKDAVVSFSDVGVYRGTKQNQAPLPTANGLSFIPSEAIFFAVTKWQVIGRFCTVNAEPAHSSFFMAKTYFQGKNMMPVIRYATIVIVTTTIFFSLPSSSFASPVMDTIKGHMNDFMYANYSKGYMGDLMITSAEEQEDGLLKISGTYRWQYPFLGIKRNSFHAYFKVVLDDFTLVEFCYNSIVAGGYTCRTL